MRRPVSIIKSFFSLKNVTSIEGLRIKVYRRIGFALFLFSSVLTYLGFTETFAQLIPKAELLGGLGNLPPALATEFTIPTAVIILYIIVGFLPRFRNIISEIVIGIHRILSEAVISATEYLERRRRLSLFLFTISSVVFGSALIMVTEEIDRRGDIKAKRFEWTQSFRSLSFDARVTVADQGAVTALQDSWRREYKPAANKFEQSLIDVASELLKKIGTMHDAYSGMRIAQRKLDTWLDDKFERVIAERRSLDASKNEQGNRISVEDNLVLGIGLYSIKLKQRILADSCEPLSLIKRAEKNLLFLSDAFGAGGDPAIQREFDNIKGNIFRCAMLRYRNDATETIALCNNFIDCAAKGLDLRDGQFTAQPREECSFESKRATNNYLDLLTQIALAVDTDSRKRLALAAGGRFQWLNSDEDLSLQIDALVSNLQSCMSVEPKVGIVHLTIAEGNTALIGLAEGNPADQSSYSIRAAASVAFSHRYAPYEYKSIAKDGLCVMVEANVDEKFFKTLKQLGVESLGSDIQTIMAKACPRA